MMDPVSFQNEHLLSISDEDFLTISQLIHSRFGIQLTDKKKTLVSGRLNKVLRKKHFRSFSEYLKYLENDRTGKAMIELIDRISTNHTFFFRERDHFDFLEEQVLPWTVSQPNAPDREIRIWCAGCATGEEAYTIAMIVSDFVSKNEGSPNIKILATDISVSALEHAVAAIYPGERIQNLSPITKSHYFEPSGHNRWQVVKSIRDRILFKRLNFMDANYPFQKKFHIIFCRNVMIYFDNTTKDTFVGKLHEVLANDGYLFLGHSETIGLGSKLFDRVRPAVYRKRQ